MTGGRILRICEQTDCVRAPGMGTRVGTPEGDAARFSPVSPFSTFHASNWNIPSCDTPNSPTPNPRGLGACEERDFSGTRDPLSQGVQERGKGGAGTQPASSARPRPACLPPLTHSARASQLSGAEAAGAGPGAVRESSGAAAAGEA